MAEEHTIKSKADELKKLRHHLNWTELEINGEYHIPPIITIERMDIKITSIEGDDIKFRRTDKPSDTAEKSMKKSSILSRFVVKKLKY